MALSGSQIEEALQKTGERLEVLGVEGPVRLYLVGGFAGMLSGLLSASRSTGDVDVTMVDPAGAWSAVCEAANSVAEEMLLPETWLNDKCRMYAWCLPLGWRERCGRARNFGPLEVWLLHRQDFVATKVVSAPGRPHDIEDLEALSPSEAELGWAEENIDRLEREHLDPDYSFDDCREILRALRRQA
jgi:hypothetical protein